MRTIGIGIDGQYFADYATEVLESIEKGRLSHISIVTPDLVNYLELKNHAERFIHHLSGVAPADPRGPNLENLAKLNEYSTKLGAVWCCEDMGVWSVGNTALPYFVPPPLTPQTLDHVVAGVAAVQAHAAVPFALEIPYFSIFCGTLSLGDFFAHLCKLHGTQIVLDLSHVFSYALAVGQDSCEVLATLPLENAVEIHVAGGKVSKICSNRYIDTHSDPIVDEVWKLLDAALNRCSKLQAITYEVGKSLDSRVFEADFSRIERVAEAHGFRPFVAC
jgi:uncharacterized protein (UPF0276 family)